MAEDKFKDWEEDKEDKQAMEFLENNLDYEKYLLDPKAEASWLDVNKDLELGNIEDWEHQAILNQEKTLRGLMGIKQSIGNDKIAELFVPEDLLKLYRRMPAFTLALSLSKFGFLQKLKRSFEKKQTLEAKGMGEEIQYKNDWGWRKKKKTEGGMQP